MIKVEHGKKEKMENLETTAKRLTDLLINLDYYNFQDDYDGDFETLFNETIGLLNNNPYVIIKNLMNYIDG